MRSHPDSWGVWGETLQERREDDKGEAPRKEPGDTHGRRLMMRNVLYGHRSSKRSPGIENKKFFSSPDLFSSLRILNLNYSEKVIKHIPHPVRYSTQ